MAPLLTSSTTTSSSSIEVCTMLTAQRAGTPGVCDPREMDEMSSSMVPLCIQYNVHVLCTSGIVQTQQQMVDYGP